VALTSILGLVFFTAAPAPAHAVKPDSERADTEPGAVHTESRVFSKFSKLWSRLHLLRPHHARLRRHQISHLLAVAIAAIAFAYAGLLYMTAAGNTGNVSRAHGIFIDVVVGIIITLIAYLIINMFLTVLISGGGNGSSFLGHAWDTVTCTATPTYQDPGGVNNGSSIPPPCDVNKPPPGGC